jgi:chemotaxis response regulator CheB
MSLLSPEFDVIALTGSYGGVEALLEIIPGLPAKSPPVIVAQHLSRRIKSNLTWTLS